MLYATAARCKKRDSLFRTCEAETFKPFYPVQEICSGSVGRFINPVVLRALHCLLLCKSTQPQTEQDAPACSENQMGFSMRQSGKIANVIF